MIRKIFITAASQLQFGAFLQNQIIVYENGIATSIYNVCYNANKLYAITDTVNPNVAVIHFGNISVSVSNADYNEFSFGGIPQSSSLDLIQSVIADAATYTS
jgi:hypothetical protein